jgi:folate-binding protein YgfZ
MLNPATMPFKENLSEAARLPALPGFSVLAVEGANAESFLQAQTMNDVRALAIGRWHWNGWLNPKGRLIALFALARIAEDRFWLVLPDYPASELLPLLQRYVFRSKVRLWVCDELVCAAEFGVEPSSGAPSDQIVGTDEGGLALDCSGAQVDRRLWLLPATSPALATVDVGIDARWRELDLKHGLPRLPDSQREAWTPQMLGLDRLNAYSLKKGCYPGQEIVARTHYLGQAKRGLRLLRCEGASSGDGVIDADGASIGSIICTTSDQCTALAVCSRDAEGSGLRVADRPVELLPLLPGLARPLVTELTAPGSQIPKTGA